MHGKQDQQESYPLEIIRPREGGPCLTQTPPVERDVRPQLPSYRRLRCVLPLRRRHRERMDDVRQCLFEMRVMQPVCGGRLQTTLSGLSQKLRS